MKVLPFVAAVVVLAELAGAVLFATGSTWLVFAVPTVVLLGVAAALVVMAVRAGRRPPPSSGYVERERTLW